MYVSGARESTKKKRYTRTSIGCLLLIIISLNENEPMHTENETKQEKQKNEQQIKNWIAKFIDCMPDSWGLGGISVYDSERDSEFTTTRNRAGEVNQCRLFTDTRRIELDSTDFNYDRSEFTVYVFLSF